MIEQHYQLKLCLQGPILSQASGTLAFGVDTAMQRFRDEPVLNGPQIRGNLRHLLHMFEKDTEDFKAYMPKWFPGQQDDDYATRRSTLDFDLFWKPECIPGKSGVRTRIEIEPKTGKVRKGALQVIEDIFPSGNDITFTGKIHARFCDKDERQCFEKWINKALEWLDAIGSLKGVGYGRLVNHQLFAINAPQPPNPVLASDTVRFGIRLRLDRPFCIGRQNSRQDNRIVSSDDIPGEVIKGVLAREMAQQHGLEMGGTSLSNKLRQELSFDELIITHAKPVDKNSRQRPRPIPLNLAETKRGWRCFTTEEPEIISWQQAPSFQPDWKNEQWREAKKYLGLNPLQPDRLLLVRTAIEEGKNIAKESALFSLECVDPGGFEWCGDIDLSNVDKASLPTVIENLQTLLDNGLSSIGKTRARADVTICQPLTGMDTASQTGTHWQIILQTPARLLPLALPIKGSNGDDTLHQLYSKYWHKESGGKLKLLKYFAQQEMSGGDYFNHHFRKTQNPARHYKPEWLTTAGSVFILQAESGQEQGAQEKLQTWLHQNLPAWEDDNEEANWQTTVHIPQHGYGEISVGAIAVRGEE